MYHASTLSSTLMSNDYLILSYNSFKLTVLGIPYCACIVSCDLREGGKNGQIYEILEIT